MAPVTLIVTLFLVLTVGISTAKVSYKGYELLSVYPKNIEDVKILSQLVEQYPKLDFWINPVPRMNATVLVQPEILQAFKGVVRQQKMSVTVLSDDLQRVIDAGNVLIPNAVALRRSRVSGHVINHYRYHKYEAILNYLSKLANKYPNNVQVSYLNHETHEGRSVAVVKLSGTSAYDKPAIIVEVGMHAREWICPASILWVMEKVLRDYSARKPSARLMLDKFDWYLVPVTNPDGYEYTHDQDRWWRKNRRQGPGSCEGVDLNRNFDIAFGTTGVSHGCETILYPGTSAFSEPETANIRDLFNSLYGRARAYVAVHSFSQMVMVPWGFSDKVPRPDNHVELDRVTKLMTQAISQRHGKKYIHGTISKLMGSVSGNSVDWAMHLKPNLISVAFELRPDVGDHTGFHLPASEIIPSGKRGVSQRSRAPPDVAMWVIRRVAELTAAGKFPTTTHHSPHPLQERGNVGGGGVVAG